MLFEDGPQTFLDMFQDVLLVICVINCNHLSFKLDKFGRVVSTCHTKSRWDPTNMVLMFWCLSLNAEYKPSVYQFQCWRRFYSLKWSKSCLKVITRILGLRKCLNPHLFTQLLHLTQISKAISSPKMKNIEHFWMSFLFFFKKTDYTRYYSLSFL